MRHTCYYSSKSRSSHLLPCTTYGLRKWGVEQEGGSGGKGRWQLGSTAL